MFLKSLPDWRKMNNFTGPATPRLSELTVTAWNRVG
jgi:hypothetical protein